jgi:hypothetical protein
MSGIAMQQNARRSEQIRRNQLQQHDWDLFSLVQPKAHIIGSNRRDFENDRKCGALIEHRSGTDRTEPGDHVKNLLLAH